MSLEVRPAPMSTKGLKFKALQRLQGRLKTEHYAQYVIDMPVLAPRHTVARSGSSTNKVEAVHLTQGWEAEPVRFGC